MGSGTTNTPLTCFGLLLLVFFRILPLPSFIYWCDAHLLRRHFLCEAKITWRHCVTLANCGVWHRFFFFVLFPFRQGERTEYVRTTLQVLTTDSFRICYFNSVKQPSLQSSPPPPPRWHASCFLSHPNHFFPFPFPSSASHKLTSFFSLLLSGRGTHPLTFICPVACYTMCGTPPS